jgi:hypothetical protein
MGLFLFIVPPAITIAEAAISVVGMGVALGVANDVRNERSPDSGGPQCPPPDDHCKRMREALERFHSFLSKQSLDPKDLAGPNRYEILRQRREMNRLIDEYNKHCARITGRLDIKLQVGPQGPSIPGTPLLHDFYGR